MDILSPFSARRCSPPLRLPPAGPRGHRNLSRRDSLKSPVRTPPWGLVPPSANNKRTDSQQPSAARKQRGQRATIPPRTPRGSVHRTLGASCALEPGCPSLHRPLCPAGLCVCVQKGCLWATVATALNRAAPGPAITRKCAAPSAFIALLAKREFKYKGHARASPGRVALLTHGGCSARGQLRSGGGHVASCKRGFQTFLFLFFFFFEFTLPAT